MTRDHLTSAVAAAVRGAPCTVRALAWAARVPDSTLVRIVAGERAATIEVAGAVARALQQWGASCDRLARRIRAASEKTEGGKS
ncbi:MAG: hypothetical protein ABR499_14170 [Gemmatimonadaceae bacterium]